MKFRMTTGLLLISSALVGCIYEPLDGAWYEGGRRSNIIIRAWVPGTTFAGQAEVGVVEAFNFINNKFEPVHSGFVTMNGKTTTDPSGRVWYDTMTQGLRSITNGLLDDGLGNNYWNNIGGGRFRADIRVLTYDKNRTSYHVYDRTDATRNCLQPLMNAGHDGFTLMSCSLANRGPRTNPPPSLGSGGKDTVSVFTCGNTTGNPPCPKPANWIW